MYNIVEMTEAQLKVIAQEYTVRGRAAANELERRAKRKPYVPPKEPTKVTKESLKKTKEEEPKTETKKPKKTKKKAPKGDE